MRVINFSEVKKNLGKFFPIREIVIKLYGSEGGFEPPTPGL